MYNGRDVCYTATAAAWQGGRRMLDKLAKILATVSVLFILAGILYFVFR
ncbi:hypothetical protein [Aneurinibacillus tyrosinisolvens]|nr:hypothetical protein [Aneurinibacillus tyrosinisolvens]